MKKYHSFIAVAEDIHTEIYLADDWGNLVQKEVGLMNTSLLPGKYKVHFGLHGKPIPFTLPDTKHVFEKDHK